MFATQSPSTPFRQTAHYSPVRPSPLGLRNTNIATRTMDTNANCNQKQDPFSPVSFSPFCNEPQPRNHHSSPIFNTTAAPNTPQFFSPRVSTNPMSPTSPSPSTRSNKFADRYAAQVANPMKSSTSLVRSKTRKMFLNRVRNERDEGRFEARGEQMMRADYLADKRRWEESMVRDMGPVEEPGMEEGVFDENDEARALDEFVSQEEAMEMAMREMEQQKGSFDDDEYDDIFLTMDSAMGQSQDMDMS